MDFNRKELIAKLRKVKQARQAKAREANKRALASYEEYDAVWFDSNKADLEALRDALNDCLANRKPLARNVLPAAFQQGYLPSVKNNNPPAEVPANTSELDAAIDVLSTVTNETISANDLSKFGVRLNRWIN